MTETNPTTNPSPPLAALCAWLLPGLGHWMIGQRKRGMILGGTLLALFTAGLLIGGIDVIDRRADRLWFAGQVLIGPAAIAVSQFHVYLDDHAPPVPDDPDSGYHRSIGRVNELGTLYCTLAGVLNLLAILDVVGRTTDPPPEPEQT